MTDAHASVPSLDDRPQDRELLQSVLQALGTRVRREQLETWFRQMDVRRADDREIEFSVTSQFVKDWLQRNFLGVLQDAVAGLPSAEGQAAPRRVVLTLREEDGWDNLRLIEPAPLGEDVGRVLRQRDERAASSGQVPS